MTMTNTEINMLLLRAYVGSEASEQLMECQTDTQTEFVCTRLITMASRWDDEAVNQWNLKRKLGG